MILVAIFLIHSGISFAVVYFLSYMIEVVVEYLFYLEFNLIVKLAVSLFSASLFLQKHHKDFKRKMRDGRIFYKHQDLLFKIFRVIKFYAPFLGYLLGIVKYE